MCHQNCHKLALLQQTVCGNWSALEIKRLVLNVTFQDFLKHLKERSTHYRRKYPDKPDLLRMCFHRTIGATEDFKFDVSSNCPSWVDDSTEEDELRWKLRSEAKVQYDAKAGRAWMTEQKALTAWSTKRADAIIQLKSMGFEEVQARVALEATEGDLDAAIAMLVD